MILQKGRLVDAILASSVLPGIFSPVEIDGQLLVDGGLTNNVPVGALVNAGARYPIGVRLYQDINSLSAPSLVKTPQAVEDERRISLSMWTDRLARTIRRDQSHLPNSFEVISPWSLSLFNSKPIAFRPILPIF